jgi:2-oxoglutarate ferredoxin oxidoreductase subunit delta
LTGAGPRAYDGDEPPGIATMANQVRILTKYCKGCELCVAACPKGVLEMSDELTEAGLRPARPKAGAECSGCTLCYQVCPDAAIEIWETADA